MSPFKSFLKLEELGSRILPSSTTLPFLPGSTPARVRPAHYALEGLGSGTVATPPTNTAQQHKLTGTANTADLNRVSVSGSVSGVGSTPRGYATGTLTFTNARGSVTVQLTGLTEQTAHSPLPKYFRYTIVSSTGDYRHLQQHGTLRLDLQPATVAPSGLTTPGTFRIAI